MVGFNEGRFFLFMETSAGFYERHESGVEKFYLRDTETTPENCSEFAPVVTSSQFLFNRGRWTGFQNTPLSCILGNVEFRLYLALKLRISHPLVTNSLIQQNVKRKDQEWKHTFTFQLPEYLLLATKTSWQYLDIVWHHFSFRAETCKRWRLIKPVTWISELFVGRWPAVPFPAYMLK